MERNSNSKILKWMSKFEGKIDTLLGILSMVAVALVVSGELVNPSWEVPWVGGTWATIQVGVRAIIWLTFVVSFAWYCVASGRPLTYVRQHWLELIVCVAWIPHYDGSSLAHASDFLNLKDPLPVDLLQLIGTVAHAWRVVRFTAQRFNAHPVFVTGSAAIVLVTAAAALLNHFEPATFPTFWDGIWYALVTITTIGYGDIVPHTGVGRVIGSVLILSGISLFAVFVGLTSEHVRERLLRHHQKTDPKPQEEELNARLMKEVLAELKTNNDLLRQLLDEKRRAALQDATEQTEGNKDDNHTQ